MTVDTSNEPPKLIRIFRPLGMESWFPIHPRNRCSPNNKYVDAIRCEVGYAYPAIDGLVLWKINGRLAEPQQLTRLETARTQRRKIRIAGILVDAARVESSGHIVVRELLPVHDEPRLEVRKCLTNTDETVKLVAIGPRKPMPIENLPEIIITPVPDHELRLNRFISPEEVVIKEEPLDPEEDQNPPMTRKVDRALNHGTSENSTPPRTKRRNILQTDAKPQQRKTYCLRRRNRS